APDTWNVTGKDSGTLDGVISFSRLGQVFGGDNTSTYTIQPFTGGGHLSLTGGSGGNTLDYNAFSKAGTVKLAPRAPTTLGFVTKIENVIGGSGDNTITGDEQDNILTGGPGNNTLSGGSGNDTFVLRGTWGTDVVSESTGSNGGTGKLDFSAVASNLDVAVNADDSLN